MLNGLLFYAGSLIIRIIYGKNQTWIEPQGCLAMVLTICVAFWMICLAFLFGFPDAEDMWLSLAYVIAFPIILIIWGIVVRRNR